MIDGVFITFEGGEGVGKSTQIRLLGEALKQQGIDVVITREPGGSPGGEEIRSLLVTGDVHRWDGMTEALLFFAARRDHVVKVIQPALQEGKWVISDRFADSTFAYQSAGQGLDEAVIQKLYDLALGDFKPDLTFVFDMDVKKALERTYNRTTGIGEDRFEQMDLSFHLRLQQAYRDLYKKNEDRCVMIKADQSMDEVHHQIMDVLKERIKDF